MKRQHFLTVVYFTSSPPPGRCCRPFRWKTNPFPASCTNDQPLLCFVCGCRSGPFKLQCLPVVFFPFNCWINNLTLKQGFSVRPNVCLSFCIYFTLVRFFLRTQRGVANFVQLVPKTHSIVLRVVDLTCWHGDVIWCDFRSYLPCRFWLIDFISWHCRHTEWCVICERAMLYFIYTPILYLFILWFTLWS